MGARSRQGGAGGGAGVGRDPRAVDTCLVVIGRFDFRRAGVSWGISRKHFQVCSCKDFLCDFGVVAKHVRHVCGVYREGSQKAQ